jgi:pimeloyl-ACP methyl ester carboxylesterase
MILILLFILAAVIILGCLLAGRVIYPQKFGFEETLHIEVEKGRIDDIDWNARVKLRLKIKSPYGYDLNGFLIPCEGSKKAVIISHGITYTLFGSVKYIDLYLKRGYSVLIYDLRNHGLSGGNNTTFGYYEKQDLNSVMDWLLDFLGPGGIVGTMGESMGAAISLQHAAIDPRVSFVVSDCSFSGLTELLKYRLKRELHLPPFPFLNLASFFSGLISGMTYDLVSPLEDIKEFSTPVLLIHGQNDTYIPPEMSRVLYDAKKTGVRKLYLTPNAGHADSFIENRLDYDRVVGNFLKEVENSNY